MIILSNGNIFNVTGLALYEGNHPVINGPPPHPPKASDMEVWLIYSFTPQQTVEQKIKMPVILDTIMLLVMSL